MTHITMEIRTIYIAFVPIVVLHYRIHVDMKAQHVNQNITKESRSASRSIVLCV